jgi:hypothetical protein
VGEQVNEIKHSPLPWATVSTKAPRELTFKRTFWQIGDADGHGVGFAFGPELDESEPTAANAEFIVRAVNSHEALVGALEDARRRIIFDNDDDFHGVEFEPEAFDAVEMVKRIDLALALAKNGREG